ncbi:hypothetical protein LshimejAT787_0300880 [Lyophyllum shimeji]|uniref:Uncharacterized protein n=1 Tax=Lyophyllum shimeji TaxID=47721 RepID=A0A9P3ULM4_LYOSH|nr:hypothetical protein LshimejAT787_0300880 [Lyophyllum shimeji]
MCFTGSEYKSILHDQWVSRVAEETDDPPMTQHDRVSAVKITCMLPPLPPPGPRLCKLHRRIPRLALTTPTTSAHDAQSPLVRTIPMPSLKEPNEFTPSETNHRSFLVTLSARALGSVGFGLSILAIWVRWFVPSAQAVDPTVTPKSQGYRRSHRRSSLPAPSAHPAHRLTLPIIVKGNANTQDNGDHDGSDRPRHVYFADTPTPLRKSPPIELHPEAADENTYPLRLPAEGAPESFPSSSSSAVTQSDDAFSRRDNYDDSIAESDSSSRRSSLSSHLPKKFLPFGGKFPHSDRSEPAPGSGKRTPPLQRSDDTKPVKRSSIGFTPPWLLRNRNRADSQGDTASIKSPLPFRRPSTPKDTSSLRSSSTDSVQTPSTLSFSLKPHRRTSHPTPRARTQPYEAPYFATPPISADFTAVDSRKSRQILHEALMNSTRAQASAKQEVSEVDGLRGRQSNVREQRALGHGHPRTLPKRRFYHVMHILQAPY